MTQRRLRVLQISHDYEGPFRRVCRQYAHAFRHHDITTVYVHGAVDDQVEADTGGDRVCFLDRDRRSSRGLKIGTLKKLAALFQGGGFDVLIAHRFKTVYLAGILSRLFSVEVLLAVTHDHGSYKRFYRRLFPRLWCHDMICVGVSDSVCRDIEKYCGDLSSTDRLFTVPNALDSTLAESMLDRESARQALGIASDDICFGAVGRLVDWKNHELLLRAFACLPSGRNARLVLIGGGSMESSLRDIAEDLGVADRVLITGHLHDAYRYMRALDVFVLPSAGREAFGIVLLEAMLARLPLISSNAPGPLEVVGESALVFESGNVEDLARQMNAMLDMPDAKRLDMANAAADRMWRKFTLDATAERIWQIPALARLVS